MDRNDSGWKTGDRPSAKDSDRQVRSFLYRRLSPVRAISSDKVALIAAGVLLFVAIIALLAPVVAPHDPAEQNLSMRLQPPVFSGGTLTHSLGTDQLGRDTLSRIVFASRISLLVALSVVVITLIIGSTLGVIAGYFGGKLDQLIMATTDTIIAFPSLLMVMAIAAFMGPGLTTIIAALSVRFWTTYARITRGAVMSMKQTDFMMAARVVGGTEAHTIRFHVIPNIVSPLATLIPLELGRIMLVEASVSFLGLGVQPPTTSWGVLVADGRDFITSAWWLITFPGIALFLTILNTNLLGSWMRLVTDPLHRGRTGI